MTIPTYDVVVVVPTRQDSRYVLQVAYNNRLYWFNVPAEEFGPNPTYDEFKGRAFKELNALLDVVKPGTYVNPTITVDAQGRITSISSGKGPEDKKEKEK